MRPISDERLRALVEQALARDPERARDSLRGAGLGPWGMVPEATDPKRRPGRWPDETRWTDETRVPSAEMPHVGRGAEESLLRRIEPWDFRLVAAEVDSGRGFESFRSGGFIDDGVSFEAVAGWTDGFLRNGRVDFLARARASRIDAQLRVITAAARWSLGGAELSLGREPVWLGPGREGAVLLSNEAPSLDLIRLVPAEPGRGPGALRGLGTWSYLFMVGRLDEERADFDHPLLLAMRVSLSPHAWVEIGATRTDMFGGDGRLGRLKARDIVKILTGSEVNRYEPVDVADNDQKAALDLSIVAPFLAAVPGVRGGRFSIEYAGEDRRSDVLFPAAIAKTVGAELLTAYGSVRMEIADTVDDSARWYIHRVYRDGYTYRDRWMGHAIGSDSRWGVLEVVVPVGDDWTVAARYEERRHGDEHGPRRTAIRRGVDARWNGGAGAWELRYGWRTFDGPLLPSEARFEERAIEIAYHLLPSRQERVR